MDSGSKKTKKRKRAVAVVDHAICTGCGMCTMVCPANCITVVESDSNFTGVAQVDEECCRGCNFCAIDCPWESISMVNPDGLLADYSKQIAKVRGYV